MQIWVKIALCILLVNGTVSSTFAQGNTDERLAAQYYSNKEFDKAVIYYEKLFDKSGSATYYIRLLNCFIELQEFKNGEKLIKREIKKNPYDLSYMVDLGFLYFKSGDANKQKQQYDKALKLLTPNNDQIIGLANTYLKYKEPEYAISTYKKGRKLLKGTYPFNFELAQVYGLQGKTELMLNEYLGLLDYNRSYLQSVQNALQTALNPDENGEKKTMLKRLLVERIQQHPDKKLFSEMLIWVYIQEENFGGAFVQAKALDRRLKEDGKRIASLAKLATENSDYSTAVKCYEYLISKGSNNYYYITSKIEIVDVYNKKITESNDYTKEDLLQLEQNYLTTLDELGRTASTASLVRGLAHLKGFYLHDTQGAIDLLKEVLLIPRLKAQNRAKAKLELADIYLFIGEIWDASLLYSQVEKDFKHDQLGEQAKFKNAKISFYTGDFAWAKTQLNVLKASTSKLIANDAMRLSIMITDNIGIDTLEAPLLLFAQADLLAYQNKNDEALAMLDSLKRSFPTHTISDDIYYKRYQINYSQRKYREAASNLQSIINDYSDDILADDAIYNLAVMNEEKFDNETKAAELYKKLMFDYQGSIYVVDSRKRFRSLRASGKVVAIGDVPTEVNGYDENSSKDLNMENKDLFFYGIQKTGNYKIYNSNKQLTREGIFKDGKLTDGKWYRYNDKGELIEIQIFKDGKLIGKEPLQ